MAAREIQASFKAAQWGSPQAISAWVGHVRPELDSAILKKLAELMSSPSLQRDPNQDARCQAFRELALQFPDQRLFVPYLRLLPGSGAKARACLVQVIPTVNNLKQHDELVALLRSDETAVRRAATQVMRAIGGKTIVQLMGKIVSDPKFPHRSEALELVVELAGHYAVTPLEHVLRSGVPQAEKVQALQYLGDPRYMAKNASRALLAIAQVFNMRDASLVPAAISAYANLCTEEQYFEALAPHLDSDELSVLRAAVGGLRRFSTQRTLNALDRRFRLGPNALRLVVLDVLETMAREEVLPSLVEALKFPDVQIRARVTEVMSKLSREGKIDLGRTIVWLLRSKDVNLKRIAVELAGTVQDKDALWPRLLAFLRDEDWWVRERVIDVLIEMAGKKIAEHIVGYLKDDSPVVRRFGVDVLARLKDPKAVEIFRHMATNDEDWWVRERAVEALADLKNPVVVPEIVQLLQERPELHVACLYALAAFGDTSVTPNILPFLQSEDHDTLWATLHALEQLGNTQLVPQVKPLTEHPHPRIRDRARNLLRRWNVQASGITDLSSTVSVSALDRFLLELVKQGGDDLILTPDERPFIKKLGQALELSTNKLPGNVVRDMITPMLSGAQLRDLDTLTDVDFSYEIPSTGRRFRANVFYTVKGLAAVFRTIQDQIAAFDSLGLPPIVRTFGDFKNGLVLVGGPTGSGKSTTLAALIDYINSRYDRHIVTIEDPIEVVHHAKKALINQREVGSHIRSYASALRAALRQDPDVILVGELRDFQTIQFAVTAAETGHLVFGTVHTVSAATTVDRMLNAFPVNLQEQVRSMLSESLRAVLCQHLLRRIDEGGRVLASEVLLVNDAVSNMIRKGKAHQIPSVMLTHREMGMQLMDDELWRLYLEGKASADEVFLKAINKGEFAARFAKRREDAERKGITPPDQPSVAAQAAAGPQSENTGSHDLSTARAPTKPPPPRT